MSDNNFPWNNDDNQNEFENHYYQQEEYESYYSNTNSSYNSYKEPSTGNLLSRLAFSYIKEMPVTYILIIANIIAYIMCIAIGDDNFENGGANYRYIMENKEYIRLISHLFLHANLLHIANNMVMLYLFGSKIEPKIGSFKMFITYVCSGIAGGCMSIYMHNKINPERLIFSGGASGAIYGIMIATFIVHLRNMENKRKDEAVRSLAYLAVFFLLSMKTKSGVDGWSHLGGAIAGGVVMFLLTSLYSINEEEENIFKILAVVFTLGFCTIGIMGANIGGEPSELADERVDFIKEQVIENHEPYTYGEVLDYCFKNGKWDGFESVEGRQVVDFTGEINYSGETIEVRIQFLLNSRYTEYELSYFGIDGEAGTYKSYNKFMKYICDKYEKGI